MWSFVKSVISSNKTTIKSVIYRICFFTIWADCVFFMYCWITIFTGCCVWDMVSASNTVNRINIVFKFTFSTFHIVTYPENISIIIYIIDMIILMIRPTLTLDSDVSTIFLASCIPTARWVYCLPQYLQ